MQEFSKWVNETSEDFIAARDKLGAQVKAYGEFVAPKGILRTLLRDAEDALAKAKALEESKALVGDTASGGLTVVVNDIKSVIKAVTKKT